jgi:hypothetical protein
MSDHNSATSDLSSSDLANRRKFIFWGSLFVVAMVGCYWYAVRANSRHQVAPGQAVAYVASKDRQPFHRPKCQHAQKIAPGNLETFANREDAIKAGHVPCKVCRP